MSSILFSGGLPRNILFATTACGRLKMFHGLRSQTATVSGREVRYFVGGKGQPLIVVHGGAGGAIAWTRTAAELCRQFRVYVPDMPGFGLSQPAADGFQMSQFVEFIDRFSSRMGLDRFHLVGHSLGGAVALHYALKSPEKVKRLVLVSSLCLGKEIALWIRALSLSWVIRPLGAAVMWLTRAALGLARRLNVPVELADPVVRMKMTIGQAVSTFKGQCTVLLDKLPGLAMPTLLVWGNRDAVVPMKHALAAAGAIPDCRVHIFQGCGHSVYREKAEEFSSVVRRFLS